VPNQPGMNRSPGKVRTRTARFQSIKEIVPIGHAAKNSKAKARAEDRRSSRRWRNVKRVSYGSFFLIVNQYWPV
jgi:hypothetical protein